MKSKLIEIKNVLQSDQMPRNLIIGFDGFIDEIIHIVATRHSETEYERMEKISDLADKVSAAAGLSTNIELLPQLIKIGGNGVIMANALAVSNMKVHYMGSLGAPDIHPVFEDFTRNCQSVTSLCDPGHTDALEFTDGKLMLGKKTTLSEVNWQNLIATLGLERLRQLTDEADLIAITNWTMLSKMNSIIEGFTELLCQNEHDPYIFIDLADPAKRSRQDILHVLDLISNLAHHSRTILGMNEKESALIAGYINIFEDNTSARALALQRCLNIFAVVIHPVKGAAAAMSEISSWVNGPYTPAPVLTTGAGDNFNAGFCLGLLLNMSLENALYTGVYTSGYYVRNAHSPSREQLIDWLDLIIEEDGSC
ncbi:MAG: carbohydrate kinase family protein [Candidatus Cloacimonetes bacterium]|nr:carbohydrate kinase family protein [Candidatus Cloacimonadota bacterium]